MISLLLLLLLIGSEEIEADTSSSGRVFVNPENLFVVLSRGRFISLFVNSIEDLLSIGGGGDYCFILIKL